MAALDLVGRSVAEGFAMFWGTLWALVLGFTLSGAVQAFVARSEMRRVLGDHRPRTVAKASFFGAISSSCSYAASALAKSLFARGADFTSVMVFMFASTNLVVELGLVLWLLIGWQFAVAEFFGGALMIALLTLVLPRAVPAAWLAQARDRLDAGESARAAGRRAIRTRPGGRRRRVVARTDSLARRLGGCRGLRHQRSDHAAQGTSRRIPDRRLRHDGRTDVVLAFAVRHRARLLVDPRERRGRAVPRDHQLRLLGR